MSFPQQSSDRKTKMKLGYHVSCMTTQDSSDNWLSQANHVLNVGRFLSRPNLIYLVLLFKVAMHKDVLCDLMDFQSSKQKCQVEEGWLTSFLAIATQTYFSESMTSWARHFISHTPWTTSDTLIKQTKYKPHEKTENCIQYRIIT